MDDEIQYRCTGFLQAEIEQFVDDIHEPTGAEKVTTTEDESSHAGSASEAEDDTGGKKGKKGKKGRPRRVIHDDTPGFCFPRIWLGCITLTSFSQIPARCPAHGLNVNTS